MSPQENTPLDSRTVIDTVATVQSDAVAPPPAGHRTPPPIPDHELLRPIGHGSYGEVWLARNIMGTFRAVKIVQRASFDREKPFEREFTGIQKFEPISRSHSALVDILQIGRTPDCFYYVMELADDAATGQEIDPVRYEPKTLRSEVTERGRVSVERCVEIGLGLASGLQHLHSHGLIHRDIKPSNIIFVHGQPKLADIGLVAEQSEAKSFVGTEGFIPPEGPGTPSADVYSLGKVLYEMATGKDRHEFPELPSLTGTESEAGLVELNAIILKACQNELKSRYAAAEQLRQDLLLMQSGKSVKRAQVLERRLGQLTRISIVGALLTASTLGAGYYFRRQATREAELRRRAEASEQATRERAYASDVGLAQEALRSSNLGRARDLLMAHVPRANEPDVRGWEWRYLWSQCQSDSTTLCERATAVVWVGYIPGTSQVLVADHGGSITLLDSEAKRVIRTLKLQTALDSAAFSPDGRLIAAGGFFGTRVWKFEDDELIQAWTNVWSTALAFTADSSRLASTVMQAGRARVWNVSSGTMEWETFTQPSDLFQHGMRMVSLADGSMLGIGDNRGTIHLVDTRSGIEKSLLKAHSKGVNALAVSPDGRFLASSGGYTEQVIKVWDQTDGLKEVASLSGHSAWISALGFSPDGSLLASTSADQTIRFWNTRDWSAASILRGHRQEVWTLAFSSDGTRLISGGKDGMVLQWNVAAERGKVEQPLLIHDVKEFAFAPDGHRLALLRPDGSIDFTDRRQPDLMSKVVVLGTNNTSCQFDVDGRLLFVCHEAGSFIVYDISGSRVLTNVTVADGPVRFEGTLDGGHTLALVAGGRLTLWSGKSMSFSKTIELPERIRGVSANGHYAVTDAHTEAPWSALRIWDLRTGLEESFLPKVHEGNIFAVQFSPKVDAMATCSPDGRIRLFQVPGGRELMTLRGHLTGVSSIAFSADGQRLFSGSGGPEAIKAWDIRAGRETLCLAGEEWQFRNIQISQDGTVVGAINHGRTLHLWRAPTFAELRLSTR